MNEDQLKGLSKRQRNQKYFESYVKHQKLSLDLSKGPEGKYSDEVVEARFIDFFNGFAAGFVCAEFSNRFNNVAAKLDEIGSFGNLGAQRKDK